MAVCDITKVKEGRLSERGNVWKEDYTKIFDIVNTEMGCKSR